ncbi:MAG: hypothetical protein BroJett029_29720 [Alphaproteobacteria bacterium]|nr:MAG: hypothetical protein BroJett029_29720 [Alphaproteobacteria bacterium]
MGDAGPALAKALRRRSTDAERRLWQHLRNRQLGGFKFRRQHPIGRYVVDFVCPARNWSSKWTAGSTIGRRRRIGREKTPSRPKARLLRFWNNDVLGNTEGVLVSILIALESGIEPAPHPAR